MSFSEETLMAYADGELDPKTRIAVEQAMLRDPAVAERVRRHQALRADVFAAFAPVIDEPVPKRLQPRRAGGTVIDLGEARAARLGTAGKRRWSWPEWGAMAATLVVGVLAGIAGVSGLQGPFSASGDGQLVAQGALSEALSQQLASSAPAAAEVKIGVSFVAKDGAYCRSFAMGASAGLACQEGGKWKVPVLAPAAGGGEGAYRQAGSAMPAAVLDAIDQRIAGKALDAAGEQAAQKNGWKTR
jgi:hypothetical protein